MNGGFISLMLDHLMCIDEPGNRRQIQTRRYFYYDKNAGSPVEGRLFHMGSVELRHASLALLLYQSNMLSFETFEYCVISPLDRTK